MRYRLFGLAVVLLLAAPVVAARSRNAAREAFQKANEYHSWLSAQPEGKRTVSRYKRAIYLYRLVLDHDPTYGGCDDALWAIASLYEEMGARFDRPADLRRAAYYYEFLAREYPTTRRRKQALEKAAQLRKSEETPKQAVVSSPQGRSAPAPEKSPAPEPTRPTGPPATLTEVRYWSNEDYTRVVLQLDKEVRFHKEILREPDRIYFDLENTRVPPELAGKTYDVNGLFIKRIRVGENRPNVTRVVLDFKEINQHTVFALYDPFRIVIDTRGNPAKEGAGSDPADPRVEAAPSPGPDAAQPPSPTIQGSWTLTRTLGLKVGKVVLDPGHGGKDTGTIGPTGLREKDVVLDVALRLRDLLVDRLGVEVIMTREDDRFVPLEERTAIANERGADLFVSIHANASRNRRAAGIETYVLDFARSEAEIEVASRENATAQRNIRELEDLLRKITLTDYNRESRDLAQLVQANLVQRLHHNGHRYPDRGVKQAPFIVLIGSNMPSILTEIGFLSHRETERLLRKEETRQLVAEGLFEGITRYLRSLGVPTAPAPSVAASER
ncbi:MAG: N-acetylmuramoyl-L-alanine amidase [Acidobacteriota bacterium]